MKILMRIIVTSIIAFALAYLLDGINISSFWSAIILAIVLSLLNAFVKPFIVLLTLPITIVSLGLFLLVINAIIILLADKLLDGFSVDGFWYALLFSLLLSILSSLLYKEKRETD
jgi:putative membrane protein